MNFQTLSSQTVYQGRVFDLLQDQVQYPDGRRVKMDVIKHNGAVAMLPIDDEGQLLLVRQYRHAVGSQLIELPAGTLEEGEGPESCAQRELREEVGMAAGELIKLGEFFLAPGYSTERMHLFLARKLSADTLEADEDEMLELLRISPKLALAMVQDGQIRDAKTLLGLLLARPYLSL